MDALLTTLAKSSTKLEMIAPGQQPKQDYQPTEFRVIVYWMVPSKVSEHLFAPRP